MQFLEVRCAHCGLPTAVRVGAGRLHRCPLCNSVLPIREQPVGPGGPPSGGDDTGAAPFDDFFTSVVQDCAIRADLAFESIKASLPTVVRRRARSMGRWMATRVLRERDDPTLPPGVDPRAYRQEELAVHVAGAWVAVEWMSDPHGRASATRRALMRSVARRGGSAGDPDVGYAALRYTDAFGARDLAALGSLAGGRACRGVLGEGFIVAASSLSFVAAWNLATWEYLAPRCVIR